ncbi:MAG: Mini-ribonuclease 3 [Eubacteriaceae bacterium]|jgi:ribonuclease-3 family protein
METDLTSVQEALKKQFTPAQARQLSPLVLAWIGDSVYTDAVRKYLVTVSVGTIDRFNKNSVTYVKAGGQAQAMKVLTDSGLLTQEEETIVRRGRNTQSHVPKNASVSDYRWATGFEALLGYLSLTGETERLFNFVAMSIEATVNARQTRK